VKRDEASWLGLISELWGPSGLAPGHGDDAVVLPEGRYAASTDFLAEGVDFETDWGPPEALGYKALAANLSDIASSGAEPAWFFLTIAIPEALSDSYVERLLAGMRGLCVREEIRLAGGPEPEPFRACHLNHGPWNPGGQADEAGRRQARRLLVRFRPIGRAEGGAGPIPPRRSSSILRHRDASAWRA